VSTFERLEVDPADPAPMGADAVSDVMDVLDKLDGVPDELGNGSGMTDDEPDTVLDEPGEADVTSQAPPARTEAPSGADGDDPDEPDTVPDAASAAMPTEFDAAPGGQPPAEAEGRLNALSHALTDALSDSLADPAPSTAPATPDAAADAAAARRDLTLRRRALRRLPAPVRRFGLLVLGRPIRMPNQSGQPARRGPGFRPRYADYLFARELAGNPDLQPQSLHPEHAEHAEPRADAPASPAPAEALGTPGSEPPATSLRRIHLPNLGIRLSDDEVESIHRHGIVRLQTVKITDWETPPADVAFVTVVNDKYAPGVEALVLSLLKQYPDFASDVIVFHDETLSGFSIDRLRGLYAGFRFERRTTSTYDVGQLADAPNHKRVGLLGYLSLEALRLTGYRRVVVIDADTIVLNDISRLWRGDKVYAVADHGALPFGIVAEATGRPVVNSGMISLPGAHLGEEKYQRALAMLPELAKPVDPLIDRFADQKFWNVFLASLDVEFLPVNYNTNKNLVDKFFTDFLGDVAVLHLTGAKPWFEFTDQDLVTEEDRQQLARAQRRSPRTFSLWRYNYDSAIGVARVRRFRADCAERLEALRGAGDGRPAVLIGNGPSLKRTDLSQFEGFQTFVFNWFVHHEDYDTVRPDHLVLASHMFFGGWHTTRPAFPDGYLEALTKHEHRPQIWTSHYFKHLIDSTPELEGYDVNYFMLERPFKQSTVKTGNVGLDLLAPLTDANTGVLTAGVPIAVHLGARNVVLVGCDSDYSSTNGSYFYEAGLHTSRTTDESHLVSTWTPDGAGQYSYRRVAEELASRGVTLMDATVDGKLAVLERIALEDVRGLLT
jgi:lipopolysaccharide biosynthesis glycosyltransferase